MVDVPANTSTTEAFEIELGENIGSYSGRLETVGDHDWLRITHHKAGELQVKYNAATDIGIVSGDINGDGRADFQIEVHSIAALAKGDFIL